VFREIGAVKQIPGEPFRRWFSCESMDLFVWFDESKSIISYQLSYNKPYPEKSLSWRLDQGFSHNDVDDGFRPGRHPASPILVADGYFDAELVLAMFNKNADNLDVDLRIFIDSGISQHYSPKSGIEEQD
jgi:hypothetical protein